jgi:hypothetical protein
MQGNVKVNFNGVRQKRFTFPNTALKLQITIVKSQIKSKFQIPIIKTLQPLLGCLALFYLFK